MQPVLQVMLSGGTGTKEYQSKNHYTIMTTLTNGLLTVSVQEHGAELCSLRYDGREYLWGAYPEYWKRHSPVLFPIVGSVWDGRYRTLGHTYDMGQHGLARDMDFVLLSANDTEVWHELRSTPETLTRYPYDFILRIGYRLRDTTVDVMWEVENPSDRELPFQIGAHPAFYWPMLSDDAIDKGVEAMDAELAESDDRGHFMLTAEGCDAKPEMLDCYVIRQKGCVDAASNIEHKLSDGLLPITTSLFDDDALIVKNPKLSAVTLCRADKTPYLTVKSTTPLVGLWSPPKKNAPFVCIEPWYGRTDDMGYDGQFEDKPYINRLAPGETFKAKYEIVIHPAYDL